MGPPLGILRRLAANLTTFSWPRFEAFQALFFGNADPVAARFPSAPAIHRRLVQTNDSIQFTTISQLLLYDESAE